MKLPNFMNPSAESWALWKLSKNSFDKKRAPKLIFFKKKNQKDLNNS